MTYQPFSTPIDLTAFKLAEQGLSWLHTMNFGTYNHPKWGRIEFNPDRLTRFAQNIKAKVRGVDLAIDYEHMNDPSRGNKAAGWVKDAEVRDNGLWVAVEWTPEGWKSVQDKEFRYLSPEFQDEWTHDGTGEVHKDVLFGAALTNRPFLKDLLPITMSEVRSDAEVNLEETVKDLAGRVAFMENLWKVQLKGGK
jgi:hypothetical protein